MAHLLRRNPAAAPSGRGNQAVSSETFAGAEHYHEEPPDGAGWPYTDIAPIGQPPDPALEAPATPRRILIVEDSRPLRELYRLVLEVSGYLVSTAEDGATGLTTALREQPDLLMVDISLPGKDGVTMLAELRQVERSRRRVPAPALLLSASASFPDVDEQALGVVAMLDKAHLPPRKIAAEVNRRLPANQNQLT